MYMQRLEVDRRKLLLGGEGELGKRETHLLLFILLLFQFLKMSMYYFHNNKTTLLVFWVKMVSHLFILWCSWGDFSKSYWLPVFLLL